jgi:uncharacterized membrane protein
VTTNRPDIGPPGESPTPRRRSTDRQVEQVIGRLLQVGVLVAAAIVLVGGVALLIQHGGTPADYHVFRGEPEALRHVDGILLGVLARDASAIVQLGLVVLIATPVARVALTLVAFLVQRDRTFVALTALVFALLVYGLVWA